MKMMMMTVRDVEVSPWSVCRWRNILVSAINQTSVKHTILICSSIVTNEYYVNWGTGIRGLMRVVATIPQGNQELLVVKDRVGRPQAILG